MYSNKYGYGVYKRNQVNLGAPYKPPKMTESIVEEVFNEAAAASEADPDMDLKIGQDIVHKAKSEAALIKHEAEQEAESIINEAKEKSEAMLAEVLQEAKEEGYRHGEELAQQHYSDLLAEAQDFKERSEREYQETIASFENNIIELVLEISEKVIGKLVEENKGIVLDIVKDTINSCSNRENITLIVSSEDYDVVVENQELLKSSVKGIHKLELREDKSLKKGSCIIDTNFGSVEGSYDVRLESIRKAFFELIGENGQEDGKDDE